MCLSVVLPSKTDPLSWQLGPHPLSLGSQPADARTELPLPPSLEKSCTQGGDLTVSIAFTTPSKTILGNSLAVQWSGLGAFTAEGLGSIPGWGTKIPQATWRGPKDKKRHS